MCVTWPSSVSAGKPIARRRCWSEPVFADHGGGVFRMPGRSSIDPNGGPSSGALAVVAVVAGAVEDGSSSELPQPASPSSAASAKSRTHRCARRLMRRSHHTGRAAAAGRQ